VHIKIGAVPGLVVALPLAAAGSYGQKYYHYSLLRTLEDGFRLGGYLGNANAVSPVAGIWRGQPVPAG
jgi:hypothetical protein